LKKIFLIIVLFSSALLADKIILLNKHEIDPVYRVPVKQSRFLCEAKLTDGKVVQFISAQSMLLVFNDQEHYIKAGFLSSKIKNIYVQGYMSGDKINAKNALYVYGSGLALSNGGDLVACKNMKYAKLFEKKHGGRKIMKFSDITLRLLRYL